MMFKIVIISMLLVIICALQENSVMQLKLRSNVDLINAQVQMFATQTGKLKDMVSWWDQVPMSNKIRLLKELP